VTLRLLRQESGDFCRGSQAGSTRSVDPLETLTSAKPILIVDAIGWFHQLRLKLDTPKIIAGACSDHAVGISPCEEAGT
jgi:hypothetical protein